MNSKKILLGVLAGLATGALLGVLFAPDKGSHTRKKVSKKGKAYTDALKDKFNEFLDSFSENFEKSKKEAIDFIEPEKSKSEKAVKEVKTSKN